MSAVEAIELYYCNVSFHSCEKQNNVSRDSKDFPYSFVICLDAECQDVEMSGVR